MLNVLRDVMENFIKFAGAAGGHIVFGCNSRSSGLLYVKLLGAGVDPFSWMGSDPMLLCVPASGMGPTPITIVHALIFPII